MTLAFVNGRILTPTGFVAGHALRVDGEHIVDVLSANDARLANVERVDVSGRLLLPGYIDTQVNGGGGVLFNDAPTVESIRRIGAAHARFGTTGFLPTLISDDLDVVARAIRAVDAAIEAGVPGVLGIHVEGPFISSAKRGVHDARHFLALDDSAIALLTSLRRGRTLLTLAPEVAPPTLLRRLTDAGVVLAAGHSNATATDVEIARAHGLRGFTHLFNAMSPLTAREPGVVGAALADEDAYCGLIVDGHHVDPRVLRLVLRLKRADRLMLVTDAMPPVGTPDRSFELQGRRIRVEDGHCVDEQGTLAGTALDMGRAVRNAVALLQIAPEVAVAMASTVPAQFLGLDATHGQLTPGARADFVVTDPNLHPLETWIGGRRCATAEGDAP